MPAQLILFETTTQDNGDGSFTLRPRKIKIEREIRSVRAMKILGYSRDTINRLCRLGEKSGGYLEGHILIEPT